MTSTVAACGGDTGSRCGERQQLPDTRRAGRDSPKSSCTSGVVSDNFCGPSLRLQRHAPVFKARRHRNAWLPSDDSDSSDIGPDDRETDDSSARCGFSVPLRRTSISSGGTSIPHGRTSTVHSETSIPHGRTSTVHSETSIPRNGTSFLHGGTSISSRRASKPHSGTSIPQLLAGVAVTPQSDASCRKSAKRGHKREKRVIIQPQQQQQRQPELPELKEDEEPIDYMKVYHRLRMGRLAYLYGHDSGCSFRSASASHRRLPPPPPPATSIPISSSFDKAFAVSHVVESTRGPRRQRLRGASAVTAPTLARSAPMPRGIGESALLSPRDNLACLLWLLGNQDDDWTLASGGGSGRSRGNKSSARGNGGANRGPSRRLRESDDREDDSQTLPPPLRLLPVPKPRQHHQERLTSSSNFATAVVTKATTSAVASNCCGPFQSAAVCTAEPFESPRLYRLSSPPASLSVSCTPAPTMQTANSARLHDALHYCCADAALRQRLSVTGRLLGRTDGRAPCRWLGSSALLTQLRFPTCLELWGAKSSLSSSSAQLPTQQQLSAQTATARISMVTPESAPASLDSDYAQLVEKPDTRFAFRTLNRCRSKSYEASQRKRRRESDKAKRNLYAVPVA